MVQFQDIFHTFFALDVVAEHSLLPVNGALRSGTFVCGSVNITEFGQSSLGRRPKFGVGLSVKACMALGQMV